METTNTNDMLFTRCTTDNISGDIGIESENVLPDYCADIERILKCTVTPRITQKHLENMRLTVSGTAFFKMLYLSPEGKISSFETQIPFTKNLETACDESSAYPEVKLKCEYVNCRALSERRFDLRSTLSLKAKIKCKKPISSLETIDEPTAQLKKKKICAVLPVAHTCENFTVMEEYDIDGAAISAVVKMTALENSIESKIVSGKLILKSELEICIAYIAEQSDEIHNVTFKLPVNHVMSVPGAEEEDNVKLKLEIVRMSVEPLGSGENSSAAVEIFFEVCADITRKQDVTVICDAYSTDYDCEIQTKNISIITFEENITKKHSSTVSPDVAFNEILDVFADILSATSEINEQGEIMLKANITVSFLLMGENGPFMSDKTITPEFSLGAKDEFCGCSCEFDVKIASGSVSGSKKNAEIKLSVTCEVTKQEQIPSVESFNILPDCPKEKNRKTALTLYFAEEGEDVFDIAKRYNTSADAVLKENSLSDTYISSQRAVLIPML